MIWNVYISDTGFFPILDPDPRSRSQSKKHWIPDPGSGSATLAPPSTPLLAKKGKASTCHTEKRDYHYVSWQGYVDTVKKVWSSLLFLIH
jgi:hypothetical protein